MHYKAEVLVISEDIELHNVLESLEALPPDPATLVMIYTVLGEFLYFKRQLEAGRQYLVRASRVIPLHELQMVSSKMGGMLGLSEPDENTKEYLSALGQLCYLDKATSTVLCVPTFLDPEYDKQLRNLTVRMIRRLKPPSSSDPLYRFNSLGLPATPPSSCATKVSRFSAKRCAFHKSAPQRPSLSLPRGLRRHCRWNGIHSTGRH